MFLEVVDEGNITVFLKTENGLQLVEEDTELFDKYIENKNNNNNIKIVNAGKVVPTNNKLSEVELLRMQNKALADRQEFLEDLIAEMAMIIYD